MKPKNIFLLTVCTCLILFRYTAGAQRLVYSEVDRNELKQTKFEIIGKFSEHVLVYKNVRNSHYITVYDPEMKVKEQVQMPYVPERIIDGDFLVYPDFIYFVYQYHRKGIVHAMAVKLNTRGKNLSEPIELDTTAVGGNNSDRVYSGVSSEDKQQLMLFKINTRNEKSYIFKTILYDNQLNIKKSSVLALPMGDRNDYLTEFTLDNKGNLVFGRGIRAGADQNISKFLLIAKPAMADSFLTRELKFDNITLDEVKLRVDNFNNRYLFTGFYYRARRTNIEGVANAIFDRNQMDWVVRNAIPLGDDLRVDARGENNTKNAFDDYFIRQITVRKDGGFIMNAESIYSTSRGASPFNRWDMMYNPYMMSGGMNSWYSPYGPYGWGNTGRWGGSSIQRYHADNIIILAFDKEGKLFYSNTIRKSQYDDDSDATISYNLINTGESLVYVYNDFDKRDVTLSYQMLESGGKISRPPTMRGLEEGYSFLPRFGKQVSTKTLIVPCLQRNYLCFARIDFM
jgi:hypothetical protein